MTREKLAPFGYLMDLLKISAKDLEKVLRIEKTSISKWRSGARPFNTDSEYFPILIEYLNKRNIESKQLVLESFFSIIYPDEDSNDSDYILNCITRFLNNKNVSPLSKIVVKDANNSLYHTQISMYYGMEGRNNAVSLLLDIAEISETPTKIYILEQDQFIWAGSNMQCMYSLIHRIEKLMDAGHTVEHIMVLDNDYPSYRLFLREMIPLAFHSSAISYFASSAYRKNCGMSIYIIPDQILIIGFFDKDGNKEMISCVTGDKLLISHHLRMIENLKSSIPPVFVTQKDKDKTKLINILKNDIRNREPVYYAGKNLSISTMSEELLENILKENNLSKTAKKRGMDFYYTLRANVENSATDSFGGYYLYLNDIITPLLFDKIIANSISAILHERVCITKEQYMRHFGDTAELLMKNPRYRVILNQGHSHFGGNSWFKRDSWSMSFKLNQETGENKVFFGENIPFINIFITEYDEIWGSTAQRFKDNSYVSKIFAQIADGETSPSKLL